MVSVPERSCAVCRVRLPQAQLQRWTVTDGVALIDQEGQQEGRGYYSCPDCKGKAKMVIEGRSKATNNRRNA